MFGKVKCKQCGTILEGQEALKNSGNTFCSEKCSDEYRHNSKDEGCCCC